MGPEDWLPAGFHSVSSLLHSPHAVVCVFLDSRASITPCNISFCFCTAMLCPASSEFRSCGTGCPATCTDVTAPNKCSLPPAEGCFCKDGYVLSGDRCVPQSECGCRDENNDYHQVTLLLINTLYSFRMMLLFQIDNVTL